MIHGSQVIRWRSAAQTPLDEIPMHLYLNAFAHQESTWMREGSLQRFPLENLLSHHPDLWGYTELVEVTQHSDQGTQSLTWKPIQPDDQNPFDHSLVSLKLAQPLEPGEELELRIVFRARLPIPIARTGSHKDFSLVAQWFPKLAVFEPAGMRDRAQEGWNAHQFHGPTEFYADFADYDVSLQVPLGWTVGATGREVERRETESALHVRFVQRAVHDFAFVTGAHLTTHHATCPRDKASPIAVTHIVPQNQDAPIARWQRALCGSVTLLEKRVGPYPYDTLTVVHPPFAGVRTCGMEYPTFITGMFADPMWSTTLLDDLRLPEQVLIHEFGHQYFYGLLATHEMEEAFLDEGFNSYWENEIMRSIYGEDTSGGSLLRRPVSMQHMRSWRTALHRDDLFESVQKQPAWTFYPGTWANHIYNRPALILQTAAALFGQRSLDLVFQEYARSYAFKHPTFEDFLRIAEEISSPALSAFLREAFTRPELPDMRVVRLSSEIWRPPLGRVPEDNEEGFVWITPETRRDHPRAGLDPAADERDGLVLMERVDSGFVTPYARRDGDVERVRVRPERPAHAAHTETVYVSEALVRGPAWSTLPTSVLLTFEDGLQIREHWDGRSPWRLMRFYRPSPLARVEIDPEHHLVLDANPSNNARTRVPSSPHRADWAFWLGAFAQWFNAGAVTWF